MREVPITNNPFSKWANGVNDSISKNQVNNSPDFVVSKTSSGIQLKLHPKYKYTRTDLIDYAEEYNPTAAYTIGDVVRVLPGKNYELSAYISASIGGITPFTSSGALPQATWLGAYTGSTVDGAYALNNASYSFSQFSGSPAAGTYVCINPVPSFNVANQVVASQGGSFLPTIILDPSSNNNAQAIVSATGLFPSSIDLLRFSNVNYYPTWPETFFNSITASIDDSVMCKRIGRYWDCIGLFSTGSGGGLGASYVGLWNTTSSYTPNQIVLIEPGNLISTTGYVDSASLASGLTGSAATQSAMPGYYLNLITAAPFTPPSGSFSGSKSYLTASTCWNIPSQPFNNTGSQYWSMIEPYPTQHYFCTDVSNAFDYFTAKTWNGFITGSDSILIAKAPRQRPSVASEIIDGITITYSSYTGSNNRTATDGTNFEFQVVFPRYTTASYLNTSGASFNNNMAIVSAYTPLNGNFVTGSNGKQVYLEECLPHRVWARRYSQ